ncbi:TolB family protein [Roseateles chitinivorans]|uniref:TolB family protein n=1 Tax=Roseateles chitinivorans TaxID=2917965 RepID=UPI003D67CE00
MLARALTPVVLLLLQAVHGPALAATAAPAVATAGLVVERVELSGADPQTQTYNLQETATLRVFARSAAGFKQSQIFWQRRDPSGAWRAPEPLPFSDPRWRDSDPHLSGDGKTLTFVSSRPGEEAAAREDDLDLFETRLLDLDTGSWTPPRRLADALQSTQQELGPERYGQQLYFASTRIGGPGKLSIYRVDDGENSPPRLLPPPINEGTANNDFTLSPDGRFAVWWSNRAGSEGGADLYLAERVGEQFGPALRLPAPINGAGFEFTPSIAVDGRWLLFASTRPVPGFAPGLSQVYRVSWPALLDALGPEAQAFSRSALEAQVTALWQSFSHAAGQPADAARLSALMHPQARVWGQQLDAQVSQLQVRSWSAEAFVAAVGKPTARALHECEIHRELRRYAGHAEVYSVVESRRDPAQAAPDYVGVNSTQWQLGPQGWQLLSLHYAIELPGAPLPEHDGRSGNCAGSDSESLQRAQEV